MPHRVTVILGAGASHGINPGDRPLDSPDYRPPLAQEVFRDSRQFREILRPFPLAEVLSSDIDRRMRRGGESLERILREYADDLSKGIDDHVTRQFLQVPLYINTLFGEISTRFTRSPDQYNSMVNAALRATERVLFLTLNYDTLLEITLGNLYGIDFSLEEHYAHDKWLLVKLHGSINWYRRFADVRLDRADTAGYFTFLRQVALPLPLEKDIRILPVGSYNHIQIENAPVYPAITVPVDGKYEINCPPGIVARATDFLATCEDFLAIGTSATDLDLLELLNQHVQGGRVLVVGRSEEGTRQSAGRLAEAVPQFAGGIRVFSHPNGFAEFVENGAMDEFFASLE